MKLKALNTFYVQHEKRVVSVGDEFETKTSHGKDLIKNGMAEFIAESELDHDKEDGNGADELQSKIADLEGVIAEKDQKTASLEGILVEKDQKIADLEVQLNAANEQITFLSKAKDDAEADKEEAKGKNKK